MKLENDIKNLENELKDLETQKNSIETLISNQTHINSQNLDGLSKSLSESINDCTEVKQKLKAKIDEEIQRKHKLDLYERKAYWDLSTIVAELKKTEYEGGALQNEFIYQECILNDTIKLSKVMHSKGLFVKMRTKNKISEIFGRLNKSFSLLAACKNQ